MDGVTIKRKLSENLKHLHQRVESACQRADRSPSDVHLVAVTKYVSPDIIRQLVDLGVTDIGERRPQELARRAGMLEEWRTRRVGQGELPATRWHMIGHLQRNKVKSILPFINLIHSVDSLRLAEEINNRARQLNVEADVLVEVNAAEEPQKHGIAVAATTHFVAEISTLENLNVCGLMAMAPNTEDPEPIRRTFRRVREIFEEIIAGRLAGETFRLMSMGMSNDFELAIEQGATHIRIGSALFEGIQLPPAPVAAES